MSKIFYTDGACSGNPGPGGFGVCCLEEFEYKSKDANGNNCTLKGLALDESYSEQCEATTNNREELKAILKVFELSQTRYKGTEIVIYSDSAYAVNMINSWIHSWSRNNWKNSKKQTVENIDLVKSIYNYLNIDFFNCQVKKISGHSGELGNEIADALATNNQTKLEKLIKSNKLFTNN